MSHNSPFSVDEYPMSTGSPFSIEEYCDRIPTTQTPPSIDLSNEFSIDEYYYNQGLRYEENNIQTPTSVAGGEQTCVNEQNDATKVGVEEIQSASTMHFRRVPRRNS